MCGMPRLYRDPRPSPWGGYDPGLAPPLRGDVISLLSTTYGLFCFRSPGDLGPSRDPARYVPLPDGGQHCVAFSLQSMFFHVLARYAPRSCAPRCARTVILTHWSRI